MKQIAWLLPRFCWAVFIATIPSRVGAGEGPRLVETFRWPTTGVEQGHIHDLQADGNTLAIGYSDPFGKARGWVLLLVRADDGWVEQARIRPPAECRYCTDFGEHLALSGDTLLIGSRSEGKSANGAVYAYHRSNGAWTMQARWEPTPQKDSLVGKAVATNGVFALIGGANVDTGFFPFRRIARGTVYVYRRTDSSWEAHGTLTPDSPGVTKDFGRSIAMTKDTAIVGSSSGGLFVFRLHNNRWKQEAQLDPSKWTDGDIAGDILALTEPFGGGDTQVFRREDRIWNRVATLASEDKVGQHDVKLHGRFGALGAAHAANRRGRVVVFRLPSGGNLEKWAIDPPHESDAPYFGSRVAWLGDQLITINEAGSAFVFSCTHLDGDGGAPQGGPADSVR